MTYNPCEKLCRNIDKEFQKFCKTDVSTVYHYTSPEGFNGILKTKMLRFTDINFLNDEVEGVYFLKTVLEYMNKCKTNYNKDFLSVLNDTLINVLNSKFESTLGGYALVSMHNYVASFSLKKNSLNMWNYYTKTPNGIGYNIAFNRNSLIKHLEQYNVLEGIVIYGKNNILKFLKKIIDAFHDEYCKYSKGDKITAGYFTICELVCLLIKYRLFFKHLAFKDEKEFRIVIDTETPPEIIVNNGVLVPYIPIEIFPKSIRSVIISPSQKSEVIKLGAEVSLKSYGYRNIPCKISNIPLRT